jgi:alcohol dehydrogenase class IV
MKDRLNRRVNALLSQNLSDSNYESISKMIAEIAEIAGLSEGEETDKKQRDFTDKLERFESALKKNQ